MPTDLDPYLVVLPDAEGAVAIFEALRRGDPAVRRVDHPSGRPWLAGRWDDTELRAVTVAGVSLAVAGLCSAGPGDLHQAAARLAGGAGLTDATRGWAGSHHVIAAGAGWLRVRGTAYGMRRVHHVLTGGVVVAGDRAGVLARLAAAPVDVATLAVHLMLPPPYPLTGMALYQGVHSVPNGRCLEVTGAGRSWAYHRWHTPPAPHLPIAEGAPRVREALATAVGLRTAEGGTVSADLSGGLDSTSVAFLAARRMSPGDLILTTVADRLDRNDDLRWARRAAAHLPAVAHELLHGDDLPPFYGDVLDPRDDFDQPTDTVVNRARATATLHRMARRGSRLHFTGYGGDHLFLGNPTHYHTLLRQRPGLTWQRLRGYRALFGWRRRDLARSLLDRRSYARALAGIDLTNAAAWEFTTVRIGWLYRPRLPQWLTPDGRALIAEAVAAASPAEPLAPTPGRHVELFAVDDGTRVMRVLADMARRAGVPLAAPYFDDHVIDASLAVRAEDRTTPFAYKPLLAEAMRPVLPAEMLGRRTKGHATSMAPIGLRRYREQLAELFEDSALGRLGLIDAAQVRDLCATPDAAELESSGLDSTLGAETWLRNAGRTTVMSRGESA